MEIDQYGSFWYGIRKSGFSLEIFIFCENFVRVWVLISNGFIV
jgi:hypothetical protein